MADLPIAEDRDAAWRMIRAQLIDWKDVDSGTEVDPARVFAANLELLGDSMAEKNARYALERGGHLRVGVETPLGPRK